MARGLVQAVGSLAGVLADSKAGWVNRRDAAEVLGEVAVRSWTALQARRDDTDTDVRTAVQKKLTQGAAAGLAAEARRTYSLEELARACDKPGVRTVTAADDGYVVTVATKDGRKQQVYVNVVTRTDGPPLVRVWTACGGVRPDVLSWALKANAKLSHASIAIEGEGEGERFVLVDGYLADEVTPRQIKAAVKELARYGDWLEQRLTGADTL